MSGICLGPTTSFDTVTGWDSNRLSRETALVRKRPNAPVRPDAFAPLTHPTRSFTTEAPIQESASFNFAARKKIRT